MNNINKTELKNSVERAEKKLKELLNDVDTIYTILTHVSQSGTLRAIKLMIIDKDTNRIINIDHWVKELGLYKMHKKGGLKVGGTGMDMGFYVVYTLCKVLFNDKYKISQQWL